MPTTTNTMGSISMMEATLPPGFRFHPRDEELVSDYLAKRLAGDGNSYPSMIDVDLNKCEPWDLPGLACVGGKEWYFFSLRDRKYATGQRTNRATLSGYWKATGKDRQVVSSRRGTIVGMRKTLVFYQGRAPKGKKTDWVMHEFRIEWPTGNHPRFSLKEDWVLCRVFYKSRGTSSRPSNETCFDDTGSSLADSHLPDTQHITFDHTQHSIAGYGQVPCFSNVDPPPPSHRRPTQLVAHPSVAPSLRIPAIMGQAHLGEFPDLGSCLMDQLPCDKSGARAVFYHFNKLESNQKMEPDSTLGEGSLERYLSETGQQSLMWNTF